MRHTLALVVALGWLLGQSAAPGASTTAGCRRTLVLWAWQRPEDLRFLDDRCIAVAWFAGQVDIEAEELRFVPRQQNLEMRPAQSHWPVVRADAHGAPPTTGEQEQQRRQDFLRGLRRFVSAEHLARGLQIDFDAPRSWRPFYLNLLADLRSTLPSGAPLTMTALASWCLGDPWLREARVSEAVPMLFRMGPDGGQIRRAIADGQRFTARACRGSVGVSLDEAAPERIVHSSARVYVFAPRAWTPELVERAYAMADTSRPRELEQER